MTAPSLVVVWNVWDTVKSGIEPLVPSVFATLTQGNKLSDFEQEVAKDTKIVLAIGGSASFDVMKAFLEKDASRVLWIHSLNTGLDVCRLPELKPLLGKIPITNARGAFSSMLGEHIVFSMLYFNRYPWLLQANKAKKLWDRHPNLEMKGQLLGIVGYGDIAKECARKVMAMGVRVQAFKRGVAEGDCVVDELGVSCRGGEAGLKEVISTSDYVLAVLPATEHTKGFFTKERIAMMKPSAVFINIGRGNTVDEPALIEALDTNAIRGAALDVCAVEPLPESSPLWDMDDAKLLLTPHNADVSAEIFAQAAQTFGEHAAKFVVDGLLPEYRVDIDRGY